MTKTKTQASSAPKRHHVDRRAEQLVASLITDANDEALSTPDAAHVLGCSTQWLEIARTKNYGPKFTRLSPRMVRYMRSDLIAWLRERVHFSTSEYRKSA